ncbi:alginate O-acetyltransferase [Alsobacter metallidurans]|uniref:Probable alginate O-acetylase AlgI n=1 Tax=Alsobacter metallidurans TaxID=340221 RepID=A0A917MIN9_9HYPH|nr:MBOAT family protein [Alsobacter metallidurans]GGH24689.1 alginate O-acetyltransferase [Alsobacter metallidurans]
MIQLGEWWLFTAASLATFWLLPAAVRLHFLAAASIAFLMMLAPAACVLMVALSIVVRLSFATSPKMIALAGGGRGFVQVAASSVGRAGPPVVLILGYLFWYKFAPPIVRVWQADSPIAQILAPLGISYFCFKLIHYAIEQGRGALPAHATQEFLVWLFLVPTFTAGPIEPFDHFLAGRNERLSSGLVVEGLTRIVFGLVKKLIVAAAITAIITRITGPDLNKFVANAHGLAGVLRIWAYLTLALIVLYLDFSAYSDIAIGVSRLFGFKIIENFQYPLVVTNLTEFWRRWHMSLTSWCRVYVYMPLVGYTRNPYLAIIITFTAVGLWHAGSLQWLAWGLWHGVGQALTQWWGRFSARRRIKMFKTPLGRVMAWAITMFYVTLGGGLVAFHPTGTLTDSLGLMLRAIGLG